MKIPWNRLTTPVPSVQMGLYHRPFDFHAKLPEKALRDQMKNWDQGGPEWKAWRKENHTIGSSTVGTLLSLSTYVLVHTFMEKLRGNLIVDPLEGIALHLGHLLEPINKLFFLDIFKRTYDLDLGIREVGVIYNLQRPWETSSPDGLIQVREGTKEVETFACKVTGQTKTINLKESLIECKCPLRSKYDRYPEEYVAQPQRQMTVSQTQDDPEFSSRRHAFLAVMEIPYSFIGHDSVTIRGRDPWKLKVWLVDHSKEYEAWCHKMFSVFIANYYHHSNQPENRFSFKPELLDARPEPETLYLGAFNCGSLAQDLNLETVSQIKDLHLLRHDDQEATFSLIPTKD